MSIKDRGEKCKIAIGFADKNFKLSKQPGWESNSHGYHGDDGRVFNANGRGEIYGPTFTTNDIVGAGINFATQEMFFTKNGKFLGTACKDVKGELYPTIGLHSLNERVELNFGQKPFLFNIEAMAQKERDRRQRQVESIPLPARISPSIVRSYLLHYGYQGTLEAFDSSSGEPEQTGKPPEANGNGALHYHASYALDHRKHLRQLVRNGAIGAVIAKLAEDYPQILQDEKSSVNFLLSTQKFVEMVKAGSLDDAVLYARTMLSQFRGCSEAQDLHLQDCLALLAYEQPADSPVGYLMGPAQREVVADSVNAAVLATATPGSGAPQSPLERLLKQLTLCHMEKRALDGGQGEVFRLDRVLRGKDGGW